MKYLKIFIIGMITGTILNLIDLSFWLEVGIYASVIAIIMIIFRNKL
jgi:hydrogenase/urease accessory protein HupE